MRKIYILIAGSALAMLVLIGIQINWIKKSKELTDEQFTNKVNMALCSAVEKMSEEEGCCQAVRTACEVSTASCVGQVKSMIADSGFGQVLRTSLAYYQINLPYEVNIAIKDSALNEAPPYSCSLMPILAQDDHWLQLIFQGKSDYFKGQMKYMSLASVFILVSICALFAFAAYYLIKQQKISEDNSNFFNHMTHEFSTPLTNIQLATKMLQKKSPSSQSLPYLDIIETQCHQLRSQVENVLHMASMEKGNFQLNKKPLDLRTLAQEAVDSMQLQIQEKQASISIQSDGPCPIHGDQFHLRNVFRNLIDNALKYGSKDPTVEIGFYREQQGWRASIKDNGIGIPSAASNKIFNRFYRCPDHEEVNAHGFGMGLAYVKKIINLHQGNIQMEPVAQGTCFELYFPNNS